MRSNGWRWVVGIFLALVVVSVVMPETGDAAQQGQPSMGAGGGAGNSNMMMRRKKMKMMMMRKRRAMMQGRQGMQPGQGAANGAGT